MSVINEETGDVCAMLQEAQRILCACAGERKLYLISRSDNCCYAVLQMETGQDPQSICAVQQPANLLHPGKGNFCRTSESQLFQQTL